MVFSNFAQVLYSVLAEGRSFAQFTRNLFLNITDYSDSEENPIEDAEDGTLKAYYTGKNGISRFAKKKTSHLDTQKFEMYLERFPSGTAMLIRDVLLPFDSQIDEFNCYKRCASILKDIIITAATQKRKPKKDISITSVTTAPREVDSDFKTRLLLEASGICANDNCNKPLSITKGEDYQCYFECVIIDSALPQDSFENNIAFCPECAARFRMRATTDEIQRVKEIKKQLIQDAADKQMLSESQVTDGVKRVIQKISKSLTDEPKVQLSYNTATIDQKLLAISKPLCIKVKSFVNEYYNVVYDAFIQMDKSKVIRFEPFSLQMKMNYIQLVQSGTEPVKIFDKLVDWIVSITNEDRLWCELIVSYFVQKCEVYNATSEQTI